MKPGDLRMWKKSVAGLADIGDLMLVTGESQANPASPKMISFLCNCAHERMTWQWVLLNTEELDETR